MGLAGSRSSRGDEFQLRIALHYLIRLLDGELDGLQVESNGLPSQDHAISVDDVVALLPDGTRDYVQVKKNQPNHDSWKLQDRGLQEELRKARDQLERDPLGRVRFFSRSPFGEFKKLQEEASMSPDESAFKRNVGRDVQASLSALSRLLNRTDAETLSLLRRISFGATREFDEWDAENGKDLDRLLPSSPVRIRKGCEPTSNEGFSVIIQAKKRSRPPLPRRGGRRSAFCRRELVLRPHKSGR